MGRADDENGDDEDEDIDFEREHEEFMRWQEEEDEYALSDEGVAEENRRQLERYRQFRSAADAIAKAWRPFEEVRAIALIGSAAVMPWKEVPRFSPYRREGVELWHACKDLDLALWLDRLDNLDALRRAKEMALKQIIATIGYGTAGHQVDIFILEPKTNRYLGRLCSFNRCPKGKRECLAPGCGATAFLQQIEGFRLRASSIAADRWFMLYDRASGRIARAADLPLPNDDEET